MISSVRRFRFGGEKEAGGAAVAVEAERAGDGPVFSAVPPACTAALPQGAEAAMCGMLSRVDNTTLPAACTTAVTDYSALAAATPVDTDPGVSQDLYTAYQGTGRRVITVPVVDALAVNTGTPMTVLGFRQFLVVPNPDGTFFAPGDPNGRIPVLYIGSPAPVQQGWFDTRYAGGSCPVGGFSGPGKVVLHQ